MLGYGFPLALGLPGMVKVVNPEMAGWRPSRWRRVLSSPHAAVTCCLLPPCTMVTGSRSIRIRESLFALARIAI